MLTIVPTFTCSPSYEELRDRAHRALDSGRLEEALRLFEGALDVSRDGGDQHLIDLAFCNYSSVMINLGRQTEVLSGLRQILMHNADPESCFIAAYNLSRAHVRDKSYKKGLFYARIARDRAETLERRDWSCSSHNQIANCLMDESYFEQAAAEYRHALSLEEDKDPLLNASLTANLGYCLMMMGDLEQGFSCTYRAFRQFRRMGAELYEVWSHLDLCYGYLELGRYERARRHGQEALRIAEASGDPDRIKNALFLLGDVERALGNEESAYEHFSELQHRFYPEAPEVAGLMTVVGMRQVVNLRA